MVKLVAAFPSMPREENHEKRLKFREVFQKTVYIIEGGIMRKRISNMTTNELKSALLAMIAKELPQADGEQVTASKAYFDCDTGDFGVLRPMELLCPKYAKVSIFDEDTEEERRIGVTAKSGEPLLDRFDWTYRLYPEEVRASDRFWFELRDGDGQLVIDCQDVEPFRDALRGLLNEGAHDE